MPAINYKKLSTPADFKKAAENFSKRNHNLRADMQDAVLCAFEHMDKHGDWTSSLQPLLDASKTFGKNLSVAFEEYVLKYSWLEVVGTGKQKTWRKNKAKVMKLAEAREVGAKKWYEMEREGKAVPFDAQKALDSLFKKFEDNGITPDSVAHLFADHLAGNFDLTVTLFKSLSDGDKNAALAQMTDSMTVDLIPAQEEDEDEAIAA